MDLCQDPKYPEQSMMIEKQPSKRVLKKMCSENMQQIYRGTPMLKCDFKSSKATMPKCDFSKFAKQLY